MNTLHNEARQMIKDLSTPNSITLKGRVWCETEQMLLLLCLKSITPSEGDERLLKEIAHIKLALGE